MVSSAFALLAALALTLLVLAVWKVGIRGPRFVVEILLLVAGGVGFVIAGVAALEALTNERAAPYETAPWLALIAIAGAAVWMRVRRHRAGSAARPVASAVPPAAAPRAPQPAVQPRGVVFVSYRRADSSDVTGRIYDRLADRFGRHGVFKDVDSIALGVDFREELAASVGQCRVLVAVIGPLWSSGADAARPRPLDDAGDYVRLEIESALQRGIPVIPVLVQGARIPSREQLPPSLQQLAYRNSIAVRPDPDFHTDMARLIRGIETHL